MSEITGETRILNGIEIVTDYKYFGETNFIQR